MPNWLPGLSRCIAYRCSGYILRQKSILSQEITAIFTFSVCDRRSFTGSFSGSNKSRTSSQLAQDSATINGGTANHVLGVEHALTTHERWTAREGPPSYHKVSRRQIFPRTTTDNSNRYMPSGGLSEIVGGSSGISASDTVEHKGRNRKRQSRAATRRSKRHAYGPWVAAVRPIDIKSATKPQFAKPASIRLSATAATNRPTKVPIRRLISRRRALYLARIKAIHGWGRLNIKYATLRSANTARDAGEDQIEKSTVTLETLSTKWTTGFASLNVIYARGARPLVNSKQSMRHCPQPTRKTILPPYSSTQQHSITFWGDLPLQEKLERWRVILLEALQSDPRQALTILRDNLEHNGIIFPAYVARDVLDHLSCFYLQDTEQPNIDDVSALYRTARLYLIIYAGRSGSASLSQRTIYLLLKYCDQEELLSLLKDLQCYNAPISTNTKLQLMKRLAGFGKIGVALSLLQSIPVAELRFDQVQMFCVMLLRADMEVEDLYGLRSSILAFMLQVGVRPNRFLADVIILNAMEAGDLNTAWRSHDIAKQNGLPPDAVTYTSLLKGIRHGDGLEAISYIYNCAKDDGCLAGSPRLRFELLYAMYLYEEKKSAPQPFSTLLPLYREFFLVQSLQDLDILCGPQAQAVGPISPVRPPVQALGLMILAWLQQYHKNGSAPNVYSLYMQHVRDGHLLIAELAETDYTFNAFMVAFGKSRHTLPLCTQVVQHMLKPDLPNTTVPGKSSVTTAFFHAGSDGEKRIIKVATPTVQTWSILLFAFVRNQQVAAAEKVLKIMQTRKQEPDQVTWTSLLSGYASMQNIGGVVNTLQRLEKTGLEGDSWTRKALSRVEDKNKLLEALERVTTSPQIEVGEDGIDNT